MIHSRPMPRLSVPFRNRRYPGTLTSIILVASCGFFYSCDAAEGKSPADDLPVAVEFNRDIRPILSDNCFYCHGPDKNRREAELRLDTEAGLHGQSVVKPGDPPKSRMFQRITSDDPDKRMPPPDSAKTLKPREIALIERWIVQGGRFEGHWAFLPVKKPVPESIGKDVDGSAAVDRFVESKRVGNKIAPVASADRVTLLRRLHFDLVGLPPEPQEVESFLNDKTANAYVKRVDALLASPHFGERMAMWWLDLVRYADSVGYHGDQDVSVSPFRQYVIDAFNDNKPFDRFTREQLAGDLMPLPSQELRIASGYNRLGMMSAEGGVQDKEYLAKYIAERVRNVSGTWLGITMGCAECHDHKFDPLATRDFYRMEAFFADIKERGLYSGANSDGNWGPFVRVPTAAEDLAMKELDRTIAELKQTLATPTIELAESQKRWEASQPVWKALKPEKVESKSGTKLSVRDDASVFAAGPNPSQESYMVAIAEPLAGITAIRLEVLPDESLPNKGPGRAGNGNFVLTELTVSHRIGNAEPTPINIVSAAASYEQTGAAKNNPYGKWAVAAAVDGDAKGKNWGWAIMEKAGSAQSAVFVLDSKSIPAETGRWTVELRHAHDNPSHTLGRFRLSATSAPIPAGGFPSVPESIAAGLAMPADKRSDAQKAELAVHHRSIAPELEPVRKKLAESEKARADLEKSIVRTLVTESVPPRMVRVLPRGNWMDDSGEVVSPGFPAAIAPASYDTPTDRPLNRLDLAAWITAPDHPLTSRVFVNRVWKILFGEALSRKVDDLGAQGKPPTHPELLDYLAARFVESGWNVKELIRSIVLSDTYRLSSVPTPEQRAADPENLWLGRQGRFRLDAESVRDNALAVSGLLVRTIGGQSVKPYQPPGYWAYLNFPTREWKNGQGSDLYRRGLYTHWQRQYLHPSLLAFDAPSREECTAERARSNTPLQSLVLLNDPSYVEAARAFAERILEQGGSTDVQRLDFAFRRALSRPVRPQEAAVLEGLLSRTRAEYEKSPESADELLTVGARPVPARFDKKSLAAWTAVTRVLLNLHETITRN